jgi:hypothetical protein
MAIEAPLTRRKYSIPLSRVQYFYVFTFLGIPSRNELILRGSILILYDRGYQVQTTYHITLLSAYVEYV